MLGDKLAPPGLSVTISHAGQQRRESCTSEDARTLTPSQMSATSNGNPFLSPTQTTVPTPSLRSRASSAATAVDHDSIEAALRPDPGSAADFQVEDNPFAFSPGQLNKLLNPKSLLAYRALGGIRGIAKGLQTDLDAGLSLDETSASGRVTFEEAVRGEEGAKGENGEERQIEAAPASGGGSDSFSDRVRVYGRNVLPARKATSLVKLMWNAYNDKVLFLLTAAAIISLGLGLYETLGVKHPPGSPASVDWIEGVAICVAIIIVTVVGALNDWQKERAFVRLNTKKDDREVKVVRSGKSHVINVHDILVGDVLHLEPGDVIAVDGIFIGGHDLKCDESSATGESDALKKTAGEQVMNMMERGQHCKSTERDPFIISGAKVLEGVGTFVCTSVGLNSSFGKIMISVRTEVEATPLQKKLEKLASAIAKLGACAAGLMFVVLMIRFLASLGSIEGGGTVKASKFMDILIVAVTIIVVAVPEGLPLAVTLALAFATTRLLKENNLVRVLRACETMGNATTICSDKTGTLTTNKMTVVAGTFGSSSFDKPGSDKATRTAAEWAADLGLAVREAIVQSVAINSTAFEGQDEGQFAFIGSKTETALLQLARDHLGMQSLSEARANEQVVHMIPFDSGKKCMGAVIKLRSGGYRLLVKGASEILLHVCSSMTDMQTLEEKVMSEADRESVARTIDTYAQKSLRTIALVYRDYKQWPPAASDSEEDGHVQLSSVLKDVVFLGVVGIQDPVRPGVPEAVRKAQQAGVVVRMVTGDNVVTAQAIATECGIYTDGGVVMEGPEFRKLSVQDMDRVLPHLQVLARSSPEDKRILVSRLKAVGETVAVTGDGTNDAPALKAADVGFSMGISGTEVAKEASSIVLMDDNFTSIIVALKWGRAVNDAVQKFLQFQITVNITAVLLAFISAVSDPDMHSVLTAVQLLWVNLIMDTFAALALATDPPTERILDRLPQGKKAPLITTNMWKMIVGQSVLQLAVTLVLHFAGSRIFPSYDDETMDSVIFNTFVWMQIFNQYNSRRLDNGFNVLEGVHRNWFFIVINCIMVGAQIAIIFVGGRAFSIKIGGINGAQWAVSVLLALLSLPWAVLLRLFPDRYFARLAHVLGHPVALAYRALGRFFSRPGRLFGHKSGRHGKECGDEAEERGEPSRPACSHESGNSVEEAPEIIVSEGEHPVMRVGKAERGGPA